MRIRFLRDTSAKREHVDGKVETVTFAKDSIIGFSSDLANDLLNRLAVPAKSETRSRLLIGAIWREVSREQSLCTVTLEIVGDSTYTITYDNLEGAPFKVLPDVVRYEHHGKRVAVVDMLKGTHRDHCLCYHCDKFKPGKNDNCEIAQELYQLCVRRNVVTPVWECPEYVEGNTYKTP